LTAGTSDNFVLEGLLYHWYPEQDTCEQEQTYDPRDGCPSMFGNNFRLAFFTTLIAFGFGYYNLKFSLTSVFSFEYYLFFMGLLLDHKLIINVEEVIKDD